MVFGFLADGALKDNEVQWNSGGSSRLGCRQGVGSTGEVASPQKKNEFFT